MSERSGLGAEAYEPVPEGESYRPYVAAFGWLIALFARSVRRDG